MPLTAGDKLGPYEVISLIGKGGMGEVYSAHDPRTGRDVAIKVSAERFNERFDREVRAVAALNHPNICTLYDVGPNYLVMELVEGKSPQGPLPLETALQYARQIAEALEAAHEKGIVHRDLKPGNIKITPAGKVKVLDFGLAKIEVSRAADETFTLEEATRSGVILGTASYMAPEQAQGKPVDKRADIWAFGVVLYELLTGSRIFKGDTLADTLAAVLTKDPDWDRVPSSVRPLLRRCLVRDPWRRLRDIGEARILLEDPNLVLGDQAGIRPASAKSMTRWVWPAIALATTIATVYLAASLWRTRETLPQAAIKSTLLPPEGANYSPSGDIGGLMALSPDGTRIVFVATSGTGQDSLWIRRLDSMAAQPLPGTSGGRMPFWSPDSRWVGFGDFTDSKLKKIDSAGGLPVTIADLPGPLRGATWSADNVILFNYSSAREILRISAAGGTATPIVTTPEGSNGVRYPWFLPDGRHFLYVESKPGDEPIRVGALDKPGTPGKLVAQANSPAVYAQGHLLYLHENVLMAQPFDVNRLETTGEPMPLVEGVPFVGDLLPSRPAGFSVSITGLLAHRSIEKSHREQLRWKDRSGKDIGTLGAPAEEIGLPEFSPDGKQLSVTIGDGAGRDIWIYEIGRGVATRFSFRHAQSECCALWSPDGTSIVWRSQNLRAALRKPLNGTGQEQVVFADGKVGSISDISRDGKWLLATQQGDNGKPDLYLLEFTPATPGTTPQLHPFLTTPAAESSGRFSPDGKWVAYQSDEGEQGQLQVFVTPFPGPGAKRQIAAGREPRWRGDGKEIYVITPGGDVMATEVSVRDGAVNIGHTKNLFTMRTNSTNYAVTPDGQKFLVVEQVADARSPDVPTLTLLENWPLLLKK